MTTEDIRLALWNAVRAENLGINTSAMIMAQCEYESMQFNRLEESFAYKPERLVEVFPRRIATINFAKALIEQGPEAIANVVYSNRMGNGPQNSGDGWRYRGRSLLMITGRDNYAAAGNCLMIDFVKNPELIIAPKNMATLAILYFKRKPWLMSASERGDVLEVSSWINLGHYKKDSGELPLGFQQRKENFLNWVKKFTPPTK